MDLQDAVEKFLGRYDNPETIRSYRQTLQPLVDFLGPQRDVTLVTIADVDYYVNRNVKSKNAKATQYKHVKNMKAFFTYLTEYLEVLDKSPARKVKQVKLPKNRPSKAMPEEEYRQLITYCVEQDLIFELALCLMTGDSAARRGGLRTLLVENIDWETRTAWVTEKGDSDGEVFFGEFTELAIKRWLATRQYDSQYVFSSERFKGAAYKPDGLSQRFRRACIAAGIGSYGPHSLRHRFNQTMIEAGVLKEIRARILRHSEDVNEQNYSDFQKLLKMVAERFHTPLPGKEKDSHPEYKNVIYLSDYTA